MPLHSLDFNFLREKSRSRIEAIELWIRRIITDELTTAFGEDFLNYRDCKGFFLIKKEIRDNINIRCQTSPFPRPIDAAFFENLIEILCNPNLYDSYFKKYLVTAYPANMPKGEVYLKFCLERSKKYKK